MMMVLKDDKDYGPNQACRDGHENLTNDGPMYFISSHSNIFKRYSVFIREIYLSPVDLLKSYKRSKDKTKIK